jgi:hypothetical protein
MRPLPSTSPVQSSLTIWSWGCKRFSAYAKTSAIAGTPPSLAAMCPSTKPVVHGMRTRAHMSILARWLGANGRAKAVIAAVALNPKPRL